MDVAQFLEKTQGLNKTQIGDYLGERDDFNLKVMHAYVDALDFTELDFDEAIRCAALGALGLGGTGRRLAAAAESVRVVGSHMLTLCGSFNLIDATGCAS